MTAFAGVTGVAQSDWKLSGASKKNVLENGTAELQMTTTITVPGPLKDGHIYQSYFQIRDADSSVEANDWENFTCGIKYSKDAEAG